MWKGLSSRAKLMSDFIQLWSSIFECSLILAKTESFTVLETREDKSPGLVHSACPIIGSHKVSRGSSSVPSIEASLNSWDKSKGPNSGYFDKHG